MKEVVVKKPLENMYYALNWCIKLPKTEWAVRIPVNMSKIPDFEQEKVWSEDEVVEILNDMRSALNDGANLDRVTTFIFYFSDEDKASEFKEKYCDSKSRSVMIYKNN